MVFSTLLGAGAGLVATVVAGPAVLTGLGFTASGIAAGSVASALMSGAAVANGGGVAAGSLVAIFQSAGAAGISLTGQALGATVGAIIANCTM